MNINSVCGPFMIYDLLFYIYDILYVTGSVQMFSKHNCKLEEFFFYSLVVGENSSTEKLVVNRK